MINNENNKFGIQTGTQTVKQSTIAEQNKPTSNSSIPSSEPGVISGENTNIADGLGKIIQPEQSTPLALNAIGSGNIMSNGLGNVNLFPSIPGYKIIGGANLI